MRSPITTHVLDTATGKPAVGLSIALSRREGQGWTTLAEGKTNADGRITDLLAPGSLSPGEYRMEFATGDYLAASGRAGFYPRVTVDFTIERTDEHYHVPLLLSPFGYSTYRGS